MTKNPYESNSPEWQLYENMVAQDHLIKAYTADIERYEQLRNKAREKMRQVRLSLYFPRHRGKDILTSQ